METSKTYLVTGSAGFIGFHVASFFLKKGYTVIGLDGFLTCSDEEELLKNKRLTLLRQESNYIEVTGLISKETLNNLSLTIDAIYHFAALASIRDSRYTSKHYYDLNVRPFEWLVDYAIASRVGLFVHPSTSSVYNSKPLPLTESDPIGFHHDYAWSKIKNEQYLEASLKKSDASIFGLSLRLSTVYGRFNRSDMAIPIFARNLRRNTPIELFGANLSRDFLHIDDLLHALNLIDDYYWTNLPSGRHIYNIGSSEPVRIPHLIETMASILGVLPSYTISRTKTDSESNTLDCSSFNKKFGWSPEISFERGIYHLLTKNYH